MTFTLVIEDAVEVGLLAGVKDELARLLFY
jgi:hypothetical protein